MAQLGPKLGKRQSLEMLIDGDDLPENKWWLLDERSWRTGLSKDDESMRARKTGSITAWRSFNNLEKSSSFWIEIIPYASSEDAANAISKVPENLLRNLASRVTITDEKSVIESSTDESSGFFKLELLTMSKQGEGSQRILAGSVDHILFVLSVFKQVGAVEWDEVDQLGVLQAKKILRHIGSNGHSSN